MAAMEVSWGGLHSQSKCSWEMYRLCLAFEAPALRNTRLSYICRLVHSSSPPWRRACKVRPRMEQLSRYVSNVISKPWCQLGSPTHGPSCQDRLVRTHLRFQEGPKSSNLNFCGFFNAKSLRKSCETNPKVHKSRRPENVQIQLLFVT